MTTEFDNEGVTEYYDCEDDCFDMDESCECKESYDDYYNGEYEGVERVCLKTYSNITCHAAQAYDCVHYRQCKIYNKEVLA